MQSSLEPALALQHGCGRWGKILSGAHWLCCCGLVGTSGTWFNICIWGPSSILGSGDHCFSGIGSDQRQQK